MGYPVQYVKNLEAVYEAAGEYLYDTNKRQGLQDAYLRLEDTYHAVQTKQECPHKDRVFSSNDPNLKPGQCIDCGDDIKWVAVEQGQGDD